MDKKLIIAAVAVVVVIAIAAFALSGGSHDDDPTHLTVAAHRMRAPELQPISSKLSVQD